MRTIRFRAKDLGTGKWLYGDLRHHKDDTCIFDQQGNNGLQVAPDTIGQFTGLQDGKGRDIFEGDIVLWPRDQLRYVVTFFDGMFYASASELNPGIRGGFPLWRLCIGSGEGGEWPVCEIVGCIHDKQKE